MKILAFVDLHSSLPCLRKIQQKAKKYKPDIILCAGDFTIFQNHIKEILKELNKLGKVYLIHGNHEIESSVRQLCKKYKNIKFAHKKIEKIDDFLLVSYGGGGFAATEKDFEHFAKQHEHMLKGKIILMTHAPPYNTMLDRTNLSHHVGCKSYTNFIKKFKPRLAIAGHIHETAGTEDKIKDTQLINPGPKGVIINI